MAQLLFLNLPVENIDKTREFMTALGYGSDPRMRNETTDNFIINDQCWLMCLERDTFAGYTSKPLADPQTTTPVEICVSADSREAVDAFYETAIAAGATPARPPIDEGFMYGRSFHDLDGYLWAPMWMDTAAAFGE